MTVAELIAALQETSRPDYTVDVYVRPGTVGDVRVAAISDVLFDRDHGWVTLELEDQ